MHVHGVGAATGSGKVMRVVAVTGPTDPYAAELVRALVAASSQFVVIDLGNDETDRSDTYIEDVLAAGSVLRHVDGNQCELLEPTATSFDAIVAAGAAVMGGVDAIVVGADELWARSVLEPRVLNRLARRGIAQVAVVEAPDTGWERAMQVWEPASVACRALAVRPTARTSRIGSPLGQLFADAGWSTMSERDLQGAIDNARTVRSDVLAGTRWSPTAQFLFEGWVVVSDHPDGEQTPYRELQQQLKAGVASVDGALLVRLDDDDFASADVAGSRRWPHAVRVGINSDGFLSPGRWEEAARLRCRSGRLRIGHRLHEHAEIVISSRKGAEWIIETYIDADYGSTTGMRARRAL